MVAAWQVCLAESEQVRPRFWDTRLLAVTLVLVGVILVGALTIYLLDRWRKRTPPPSVTASEQLAAFRELYERGEISQREFERIKTRLAPLVRQELNVPPPQNNTGPAATDANAGPGAGGGSSESRPEEPPPTPSN
jgi:hypothetical protein